jgi:hypothetical protein
LAVVALVVALAQISISIKGGGFVALDLMSFSVKQLPQITPRFDCVDYDPVLDIAIAHFGYISLEPSTSTISLLPSILNSHSYNSCWRFQQLY